MWSLLVWAGSLGRVQALRENLFPSAAAPPYELPLTLAQFERALRKGHGRAWQHAMESGIADRLDSVVHACLHDLTYDPECEWGRGEWMAAIAEAAGAINVVAREVVRSISRPAQANRQFWDDQHRCVVLKEFAQRNERLALQALHQLFRKSDDSMDLIGCEQIIELEGADGLIFVCDRLGGWIADDASLVVDEVPLTYYDERHGAGAAARILESARATNPNVARYLAFIAEQRRAGRPPCEPSDPAAGIPGLPAGAGYRSLANVRFQSPPAPSGTEHLKSWLAADVIQYVRSPNAPEHAYWLTQWGRHAAEEDLLAVAEELQSETEPHRLTKYLRAFIRRRIPILTDQILSLAQHDDAYVRWSAYSALSGRADGRVRDLALRLLRRQAMTEGSLRLFKSSYEPGDHEAIEDAIFVPGDEHELHTVISDLVDVFEAHPLPSGIRLMLFAYEHSPCGNCRSRATEVLARVHGVPAWLAEECQFDAMDDTRERFARSSDSGASP